ncbi:MAG: hypothetical protein RLZZ511_3129, partial [Cyanobacteriota bacterium]
TLGIELKVWRSGRPDPKTVGLTQLENYLTRIKQAMGWLVIFDRRENAPEIAERLSTEIVATATGKQITVIRA